ncbi:MAG TPA: hypothetical protein VN436_00060 [Holophaga sp.]|nr:hypothetical protein [Holophaga sp.]
MSFLRLCVLLSAAWCVLTLALAYAGVKAFGTRQLFARPAGDPARGVAYAFTKAMLPWAKESVRTNLLSYAAGMTFHAGVFAAFLLLLLALSGFYLPWPVALPVGSLALVGGIAGLALIVKRLLSPVLRGLSVPDDFISNLLSSGFALLGFAGIFAPVLQGLWMAWTVLLLLYLPLGKIRHCVFFFTTRYHLGAFFGRRGTFPPGDGSHA